MVSMVLQKWFRTLFTVIFKRYFLVKTSTNIIPGTISIKQHVLRSHSISIFETLDRVL